MKKYQKYQKVICSKYALDQYWNRLQKNQNGIYFIHIYENKVVMLLIVQLENIIIKYNLIKRYIISKISLS